VPRADALRELVRWAPKAPIEWLDGFVRYHFTAVKRAILIVSPIRSGSTLLKALLANSEDVSHIDEVNFQLKSRSRYISYSRVARLSERPILVLKWPAWFAEVATYPRLPKYPHQAILLYREPLATTLSIKRRMATAPHYPSLTDEQLLDYWCQVYENACSKLGPDTSQVMLVRYGDLVSDPVGCQHRLFSWIGTSRYEAKATYGTPESGDWAWQKDDAGSTIKSGVVRPASRASDPQLEELIARSARVSAIEATLTRYGSASGEPLERTQGSG
jgi:hypothetical protein